MNWQINETILDRYEEINLLGEGGFGRVHRVLHKEWDKELAVKIPRPETIKALGGVEAFKAEAQTWVDMGLHPHVVSCYYVKNIQSTPFVFAEYISGGSLYDWIYYQDSGQTSRLYNTENSTLLDNQPASKIVVKRIIDIAIQFAWGLNYAHEKNLVHKDVKPSNVMLMPEGTVKVTDFGLTNSTSEISSDRGRHLDTTLMVSGGGGTPAYFSPEQAKVEKLTRRSDLFSWALSVLEMFKGEKRWNYGNWVTGDDLDYYLELEPQLPNYLNQMSIPDPIEDLLRECLQENPEERPHNMMVVADRLEAIYEDIAGIKYFREKPKLADLVADDCNNRALSKLELGQPEKARKLWLEALTAKPQHPEATYNYGLFQWRKAEINDDVLVENLQGAISSNPDSWIPKYLLAQVHLERDDCYSAEMILQSLEEEGVELKIVEELLERAIQQKNHPQSTKLVNSFLAHSEPINSLCLSSDNKLAVSGSNDKTVKLWDIETRECLRTFEGHQEAVLCVCLSSDNKFIVSGSSDKSLKIWNTQTGSCQTIQGFKRAVSSVYLSDDARLLLTGEKFLPNTDKGILSGFLFEGAQILLEGEYKNLKLWNFSTKDKECLFEFEGHTPAVRSCCLDRDNKLVLSGGGDRVTKLWDIKTGKCLKIFGELNKGADAVFGHKSSVSSVAFTQDGILSGSDDSTIKLWDKNTGECLQTLEGHKDRVSSVSVTKDGKFALSSEESKKLKLWDLSTGQCLRTFEAHSKRITSTYLSQDGKLAISGGFDRTIEVRQLESLTSKANFSASFLTSRISETEYVLELESIYKQNLQNARKALKQNDYLTAKRHLEIARQQPGYSKKKEAIELWSKLYIYLPRQRFRGAWLTKAISFLSSSEMGQYHFRKTPKLLGELHSSVHLGEDNSLVLVGRSRSNTFNLEILYFPNLNLSKSLEGFEQKWSEASNAGNKLKEEWLKKETHSVLEKIKYTARQGSNATKMISPLAHQNMQWGGETCLYLSIDNSLAVSGHELGRLKLYDVETGKLIWTYRRHGIVSRNLEESIRPRLTDAKVNSVCISRDNKLILSGGADKTLKLWEIGNESSLRAVAQGDCLRTFQGHQEGVLSVCLSSDNQLALSGSADRTLKLWHVPTGECLKTLEGHQDSVNSVCLSSDAKFAFSASADTSIKYWNLATEECLRTFQGHTKAIDSISLSVDQKFLLSGSDDLTVRLWNIDTGECLEVFRGHQSRVTSVCLAANNQYAISADGEQIKVWFLDWELGEPQPIDWDEDARPYLETFIKQHIPYSFTLPNNRKVTEEEIINSLTREGIAQWTDKDFESLLRTLAGAGYGWLNPDEVREQLEITLNKLVHNYY